MNTQTPYDIPTLQINKDAVMPVECDRPIMIMAAPNTHTTKELKAADRITQSCFENVKFLNNHLSKYSSFLKLPYLVENALYLAYTVEVKPNPYFTGENLKHFLNSCGIETSGGFSFEENVTPTPEFRTKGFCTNNLDTFCIACHQNLTVLDMQSIAKRIDTFFCAIFGVDNN
jgi:hypothetical protein